MEEKTKKVIDGLGLTFKIISGSMFCSGFMGFLMFSLMKIVAAKNSFDMNGFGFHSNLLSFFFKNFGLMALIQCVASALIFWVSFQFVKLRFWAKKVLEIFCLLLLAWFVQMACIGYSSKSLLFQLMSFVSMMPWVAGVGVLIWFLRKKDVNEAFKHNELAE